VGRIDTLRTSYPHEIQLLQNIGYVSGYDEIRKNPAWVCYQIFKDEIEKGPKRPSRFRVDSRTKSKVSHDDYTHSGYDRGHMAPNYAIALRYGVEAQNQTFLMSNIVPQSPDLNQGPWRELEEAIGLHYANDYGEVWVITGPIYDSSVEVLKSGVEIPDAFYKIVIDQLSDGQWRALAFIMPQTIDRKANFPNYLESIDEIERVSGFDFMSEFDDGLEARLESQKSVRVW
jgi:endonuclease G, mitochondrial